MGVVKYQGFRIVSIERALVEGLKYHTKIGESTGFKAVVDAIKNNQTTEGAIYKMAKELGLLSYVNKQWELITTYE